MKLYNTKVLIDSLSGNQATPEDVLRLMRTILEDVRWENSGCPVNRLRVNDVKMLVDNLTLLSNAMSAIYTTNSERIAEAAQNAAFVVQNSIENISDVEKKCSDLEALLAKEQEMSAELQRQRACLKVLQADEVSQKMNVQELQKEIARLREDLDNYSGSELEKTQAEHQQLKQQVERQKQEFADISEKVNQLRVESVKYSASLAELRKEHAELTASLKKEKDMTVEKQRECEAARTEKQQQVLEYEEADGKLKRLQDELFAIKLKTDDTRKRMETYASDVLDPARADLRSLEEAEQRLKQENDDLDQKRVEKNNAIEELKQINKDFADTVDVLSTDEKIRIQNRNELQKKKDDLNRRIAEINECCAVLQKSIQELEKQCADAQGLETRQKDRESILKNLLRDCEECQKKIDECNRKITEQTKQNKQLHGELTSLESREKEIQEEINRISQQLSPLGDESFQERVAKQEKRRLVLKEITERMTEDWNRLHIPIAWEKDAPLIRNMDNVEAELRSIQNAVSDYVSRWSRTLNSK